MSKKTKKLVFYIAVLVFIILSFLVMLFAFGYRYDFVQHRFFKTGSLELKTNVRAEVYINDKLIGNTSFLSNSFSKGQFLPRTYNLRLESDKFQPWKKLVKIEAGFLVSFPKIVLLPQNFESEIIASSSINNITIKRFDAENNIAIIGNKQKLDSIDLKSGKKNSINILPRVNLPGALIVSPDGNKNAWIGEREIWVRWVNDSSYQPLKLAGNTELITRFSQTVEDLQWFKDSEHLVANVGGILKFIEIDDRGEVNINDISTISGPFYYDRNQDAIFKFEGNRLIRIILTK
ncbi:MAG: hypothetical protein HYT61_02165 [Candidatus Yanofskybacteria bacterium]|nr:hypothetical protein [Candidatus Yanofskybacteria bacterium]